MSEIMHVGIEDPVQKRKELLGLAIGTVQTLKDFEIHKKINKEKDVYKKQFVEVVKDLSKSIAEFKDMLPQVHIPQVPKPAEKPKGTAPKVKIIEKKKPAKPIVRTDLDKLNDEAAALRAQIASL